MKFMRDLKVINKIVDFFITQILLVSDLVNKAYLSKKVLFLFNFKNLGN